MLNFILVPNRKTGAALNKYSRKIVFKQAYCISLRSIYALDLSDVQYFDEILANHSPFLFFSFSSKQ